MVPGSTLMYGSSLHIVTFRPRHLRRRPSEEAVSPLPSDEDTPPVKKMYLVRLSLTSGPSTSGTRRGYRNAVAAACGPQAVGAGRARSGPGVPEELAGVTVRGLAVGAARQHPADLDHPPVAVERDHLGSGAAARLHLADLDLVVGAGRHLGQVGDHEHLRVVAEPGQRRPHRDRRLPPDPGVHLVEDQHPGASVSARRTASMVRDSSPPEATLASGGVRTRRGWRPARRRPRRRCRRPRPGWRTGPRAWPARGGWPRSRRPARGRGPATGQGDDLLAGHRPGARSDLAVEGRRPCRLGGQGGQPGPAVLGEGQHLAGCRPVLAPQLAEELPAGPHLAEAGRIVLPGLDHPAQLGGQVGDVGHQRPHRAVEPGQRTPPGQGPGGLGQPVDRAGLLRAAVSGEGGQRRGRGVAVGRRPRPAGPPRPRGGHPRRRPRCRPARSRRPGSAASPPPGPAGGRPRRVPPPRGRAPPRRRRAATSRPGVDRRRTRRGPGAGPRGRPGCGAGAGRGARAGRPRPRPVRRPAPSGRRPRPSTALPGRPSGPEDLHSPSVPRRCRRRCRRRVARSRTARTKRASTSASSARTARPRGRPAPRAAG